MTTHYKPDDFELTNKNSLVIGAEEQLTNINNKGDLMTNKQKRKNYTTPKGTAIYPYLCQPDEFQGKKSWKVNLAYTEGTAECNAMLELIDRLSQEAYETEKAKLKPAQRNLCRPYVPYNNEYDKDNRLTGRIVFKFKSKFEYLDKVSGKMMPINIDRFDKAGKATTVEALGKVGSGSILKVNWFPISFYNSASESAGISMKINAVQFIDIVEFGADAGQFGFSDADSVVASYGASDF